MKKITKYKVGLLLCLSFSINSLLARVDTADLTGTGVGVQAFDEPSGLWVLGASTADAQTDALVTVGPANGTTTQSFTSIAADASLIDNKVITYLTLSREATNGRTRAVCVTGDNLTDLNIEFISGTATLTTSDALKANHATPATDGADTAGIVAIAASPGHVFAVVKKNGGDFGDATTGDLGGIAVGSVNDTTNVYTQLAAVTGETGVKALAVNESSAEIDGATNAATLIDNTAVLHYSKGLDRLYLGVQGASNATDGNQVINTVACYKLASGKLTNVAMRVTQANIGTGADAANSNIVGAKANAVNMAVAKLDTMHTSTDRHYLIVNGGFGLVATNGHKVFAVPLVGPNGDVPGACALVSNTATPVVNFEKSSSAAAELLAEDDTAAIVGGAALPVAAAAAAINQMTVVGDTVYCSANATVSSTEEPGLWYSQAIFNDLGTIVKWTNWSKAVPNEVSGAGVADGSCKFFAVDAARGKIWTIANGDLDKVHVNIWGKEGAATTYRGQINSALTGGCYSFFHLGQHVKNLGDKVLSRYALFGGDNQVVAIRTGLANTTASYTAIEQSTGATLGAAPGAWNADENKAVSLTLGLENAGPITALGWSGAGESGEDTNFLFAGGNKGLYIYGTNAGAGFVSDTANVLGAMNHASSIFSTSTHKWHAHTGITDPVVKIINIPHATDPVVLVLTHGTTHKVWRIQGGTTTTDIDTVAEVITNTAAVLTAGLAGDDFATVSQIHDIQLVPFDGNTETKWELLVSTDLGDYISVEANGAGIVKATAAADMDMAQISDAAHLSYFFSAPSKARPHETVWTVDQDYDASTGNPSIKSRLNQLCLNTTGTTRTFDPANDFTSNSGIYFDNVNRLVAPLYSNGSMRFMANRVTPHSNTNYSTLNALPYKVGATEFNMTALTAIPDSVIANDIKCVYWIDDCGAGHIMAGTDIGVISLE